MLYDKRWKKQIKEKEKEYIKMLIQTAKKYGMKNKLWVLFFYLLSRPSVLGRWYTRRLMQENPEKVGIQLANVTKNGDVIVKNLRSL